MAHLHIVSNLYPQRWREEHVFIESKKLPWNAFSSFSMMTPFTWEEGYLNWEIKCKQWIMLNPRQSVQLGKTDFYMLIGIFYFVFNEQVMLTATNLRSFTSKRISDKNILLLEEQSAINK